MAVVSYFIFFLKNVCSHCKGVVAGRRSEGMGEMQIYERTTILEE